MGRSDVQVTAVKRFDQRVDNAMHQRLGALSPGAYTRLGAAIRHGAAQLEKHGGTTRRLLLVLSDGLAYDHGYDGEYGEADARRALSEARRRGTACLCISVGAVSEPAALRRVFGTSAHASVASPEQLVPIVRTLFHTALGSAEAQRRRFTRAQRGDRRLAGEKGLS
jgi:nitric oxide reductase activation protein